MAMTHRLTMKLGDGGQFAVFDLDLSKGKPVSSQLVKFSQPITTDFIQDVMDLVDKISDLTLKYSGLKSVAVMEQNFRDIDTKYGLTFDDLPQSEKDKYKLK